MSPESADRPTPLRSELTRKAVHVAMGGFAFLLRFLTPLQAVLCAVAALLFNVFVLHRLTRRSLLRAGERSRGFSWGIVLYPATVLALIVVFSGRLELAAAGWALIAFGDGMATVAGVLLRGPRLPWNPAKSWAGFVAFVIYGTAGSALLIRWTQQAVLDGGGTVDWIGDSFLGDSHGALASATTLLVLGCLAASLAAALAESAETGIDDNLLVPLVGGATLWLATLVRPDRVLEAAPLLLSRLPWGLALNVLLAASAFAIRGVSVSGAVWGAVLGTALYVLAGWPGFALLLAFFVVGTATTKIGYRRKAALGIAQEKGGRRGARHAFANTTAGVLFAWLAVATPYSGTFVLAAVAAFATAACDTASSEIGQAFGRRHYLVTTLRRVPAGTDGAVSVEGTLGGIVAATLLAALAWAGHLVTPAGAAIVVVAAVAGATLESYLGATLERRLTLSNEIVNFSNTVAGGIIAATLHLATHP